MTVRVGFAMLVHDALDRAAAVARHWAEAGSPVAIHVDSRVGRGGFDDMRTLLAGTEGVSFVKRRRCEWGTWSLVSASQAAADRLLADNPDLSHVFLASGSCLPLRPVSDLSAFLASRPDTDFIESVSVDDVPWAKGGLDAERFTLVFPFSWKRQRRLFDLSVGMQRGLRYRRRLPAGVAPHLGSQWWCLTRETLERLSGDPRRAELQRFFRTVWIPDESYYQSLVRLYARRIESRSLTLSKFDFQGKPHVFYDDHLELLRRSDCFVARKIWPRANRLYGAFLGPGKAEATTAVPAPARIDRAFSRAVDRRTRGRDGLYSMARYPHPSRTTGRTAAPYLVYHGIGDLFEDLPGWVSNATRVRAHGHLFDPDGAQFADGQSIFAGALPSLPSLRDYNPQAFLTNLVWNTRGETQAFLFGPGDRQEIAPFLASDANARILVVSGAWAVALFRSGASVEDVRKRAAELQKVEAAQLERLRCASTRAEARIWTLGEFLDRPSEVLQAILDSAQSLRDGPLVEAPLLHDLNGFDAFLQDLRNQGMQPHLTGDIPEGPILPGTAETRPRAAR